MLALMLLALVSCRKRDEQDLDQDKYIDPQTVVVLQFQKDSTNPANPLNPFDEVGASHNKILGLLRKHLQETGRDDLAAIDRFLVGYYKREKSVDVSACLKGLSDKLTRGGTGLGYWIKSGGFSDEVSGFLGRLVPITEILETEGLPQYLLQLKALESEIMDADIPEKDRGTLLMVTSIARYSGYYWGENVNHLEQNPKAEMPRWLLQILAAKAFVCMDIIGAVIGTFEPYNPYDIETTATALSAYCYKGMLDLNQ